MAHRLELTLYLDHEVYNDGTENPDEPNFLSAAKVLRRLADRLQEERPGCALWQSIFDTENTLHPGGDYNKYCIGRYKIFPDVESY